ncbi:hypothetical protein ACH5RR_025921 [Cinchona calisaya]|uniref:Pectinesterase inhibitor domain-containing protein n=1 Tax=Cinchona calisaya TaxID=153742 RepID=A0ABD2Z3B0_9GENT
MKSISPKDSHLLEDQASRRKRKITSFIFFIVLFTLIIGSIISVFIALKQEADSESLSASNPEEAIISVCDQTPFPTICFNSTWSLQRNLTTEIKTTPSRIFTLSLHAALHELLDLISANQMAISKLKDSRILSALKGCDGLIRDSIRLTKKSITTMGVDPDDKIFLSAI